MPTAQTQKVPLHVAVILGTVGMEIPVQVISFMYIYKYFMNIKKKNLEMNVY